MPKEVASRDFKWIRNHKCYHLKVLIWCLIPESKHPKQHIFLSFLQKKTFQVVFRKSYDLHLSSEEISPRVWMNVKVSKYKSFFFFFFSIWLVPGPRQQSTVLSPAVKCIPWIETLYQEQVLPCEVPCNWLMKFYGRLLQIGKRAAHTSHSLLHLYCSSEF